MTIELKAICPKCKVEINEVYLKRIIEKRDYFAFPENLKYEFNLDYGSEQRFRQSRHRNDIGEQLSCFANMHGTVLDYGYYCPQCHKRIADNDNEVQLLFQTPVNGGADDPFADWRDENGVITTERKK